MCDRDEIDEDDKNKGGGDVGRVNNIYNLHQNYIV